MLTLRLRRSAPTLRANGVVLLCLALSLALTGCHRARYYVTRVEVSSEGGSAPAGRSLDEWKRDFVTALKHAPGFVLLKDGQPSPEGAPSYQLLLIPQSAVSAGERQVLVTIVIRRSEADAEEGERFTVSALQSLSVSAKPKEIQASLTKAMQVTVEGTRLQLRAFSRSDGQLISDLGSKDAQIRSCALKVLVDRKSVAAEPALIKQLSDPDLDAARAAVGGLVAIGDPKAVPALIDAGRGRPPEFKKELLFAVAELGGDEAHAYLYTVSSGADLPDMQKAAREALEELTAREQAHTADGGQREKR